MRAWVGILGGVGMGAAGAAVFGCGGTKETAPSSVAGTYTVTVTSRDNGCAFANWKEGEATSDVKYLITQNGTGLTGEVQGVGALAFEAIIGSRTFSGTANGGIVAMTSKGTRQLRDGTCSYTVDAALDATVSGNAITGKITYTANTTGAATCSAKTSCASHQDVSGSHS